MDINLNVWQERQIKARNRQELVSVYIPRTKKPSGSERLDHGRMVGASNNKMFKVVEEIRGN